MPWSLWIDDYRVKPKQHTHHAKTYEEAIALIEELGWPKHISFDHDLGWDDKLNQPKRNGYNLALWIRNEVMGKGNSLPDNFTFSIQSANPVGAANIRAVMKRLGCVEKDLK